MSHIDRNHNIHITQGDSWEMDIRLFNRDWHLHREPHDYVHGIKVWPLIPLIEINSEGESEFVFNSEGYPIYNVTSEGRPYWVDPLPIPKDSEGQPIIDIEKIRPQKWPFLKRYPWPRWPEIEERIHRHDLVTLRVVDPATREVVLEKYNDEYPNTIFFLKGDTAELEPKFYMYSLIYERYLPDLDDEDKEKDTVIRGMFEVVEAI